MIVKTQNYPGSVDALKREQQDERESAAASYKNDPFRVFAHVHMAKTAGSEINVLLASPFERVCGNKADSTSIAEDVRVASAKNTQKPYQHNKDKIGYDDCDFIAEENIHENFWKRLPAKMSAPVELHIPCRHPIDHLLSQCNYRRTSFECVRNTTLLEKQVED